MTESLFSLQYAIASYKLNTIPIYAGVDITCQGKRLACSTGAMEVLNGLDCGVVVHGSAVLEVRRREKLATVRWGP